MMYNFNHKNYSINIEVNEHGAVIEGGEFGDIRLLSMPVFSMRIKRLADNKSIELSSLDGWDSVDVKKNNHGAKFCFKAPLGITDICIFINAS